MTTKRATVVLSTILLCASVGHAQEQTEARPDQAAQPAKAWEKRDYSPFPNPDAGYVTDLANLLSYDQEEQIERWLWQVESRTQVEIIVVTIDSLRDYADTPNRRIEDFARGLFDAYGIGNMPKNDGVLLLIAGKDRRARIELGAGYGRARDDDANRIMQGEIIPHFREDEYAEGIAAGVRAIMLEFAGVRVGINWLLIGAIVAVPVAALIAVSLFRRGKRGWGWICVGLLIVLVMTVLYIVVKVLKHMPVGRSSGWSSGGIGGFGGGFSGGGGASGSW